LTLSNQQPIGSLGLQYQFFVAEMSYSKHILWNGVDTAGHPRMAGLHLGIEPVDGWAISGNSVWQFGGGGRPGSFKDFLNNFFKSTNFHGEFYRFRETDLSAGLHFPEFLDRFDLTLEASEWENAWYTDYVWLDGMT